MRGPELSRGPKAYPSVKSRTRFSQATRFEDPTAVYSEILEGYNTKVCRAER